MRKVAIGASIFAIGYLLFHPEQPSHYVELKDQPVGNIQTLDPNRPEAETDIINRDPSAALGTKIVFEK